MKIKILTIFPEMFESVLNSSILGRAREQGLIEVECVDIRPFSTLKHKNTDDYPFGGGAGMVMLAQPIMDAMKAAYELGYFTGGVMLLTGPRNDAKEASRRLFSLLRRADEMGLEKVYALLPPASGEYLAYYNRIVRAAGCRIIKLGNNY